MEKLKSAWKNMTGFEKTLVMIRDLACFGIILTALLNLFELLYIGTFIDVLLPVAAIAQALLSWKRSKATALFFLAFLVFFILIYVISNS